MRFLSDRLPEALKKQPIWKELIECFDELFKYYFDRIERFESGNSIFTANDTDLDLMIEEAGDIFNVQWNDSSSKPLSILWRKGDIKLKATSVPMEAMLNRAFVGLNAQWSPYYHPKGIDYRITELRTEEQIADFGDDITNYFLTSRGYYSIDTAVMLEKGISQGEILEIIGDQIEKIIPLHIVFDGIRFLFSAQLRDMSINTSGEYKATESVDYGEVSLPILTRINYDGLHPIVKSGTTAVMTQYANDTHVLTDDIVGDFWPVDLPLFISDE